MKKEKLDETIGDINDNYINEAHMTAKKYRPGWLKWGIMAACLTLIVATGTATFPMLFNNEGTSPTIGNEYKYESGYFYNVDEGDYSTYVGGKVITADKIEERLTVVSVTAGWRNAEGKWTTTEKLHGEIYTIDGVSSDVAVALKFLDKGEAVTTTHYYVIMNPNADLTPVEEYTIAPITPNNPGDEIAPE